MNSSLRSSLAATLAVAMLLGSILMPLSVSVASAASQCSDAVDNDGDSRIDYPEDANCLSPADDTESSSAPAPQGPLALRACNDGIDNDTDGATDFPLDGGCENAIDNNEGPGIYAYTLQDHPEFYIDPPLEIRVTDGREFAVPGEVLNYRITVRNVGSAVRNFDLRTVVPVELQLGPISDSPAVDNRTIIWPGQTLPPGASRTYAISARILDGTPDLQALRLKVYSDRSIGYDTTSVFRGIVPAAFSVSVTDNATSARPGDMLDYVIVVSNAETRLATDVDVNVGLPIYTEFVAASEGGAWTGKNVRWTGLSISPKGERTLNVRLRVRSDAPIGATLQFTAEAKGQKGGDLTNVAQVSDAREARNARDIILRKTADRDEVNPGDAVTYTVYLRNVTDHPITHIQVEDRMDQRYMTVIGGEAGLKQGDRILWDISVLQPGQVWEVRYTVLIARETPHGESLLNVVSVRGDGMETVSLGQRVYTGSIGVVRHLPPTGAALDVLFVLSTMLLGAAPLLMQRRKFLGMI